MSLFQDMHDVGQFAGATDLLSGRHVSIGNCEIWARGIERDSISGLNNKGMIGEPLREAGRGRTGSTAVVAASTPSTPSRRS